MMPQPRRLPNRPGVNQVVRRKEFKQAARERIPSLLMELGEYDHGAVEAAARELWEAHHVHRYDRDGVGAVFSVDTPPPYVSAAHLHVGHAMSYSQPDFIVRYRRMRGDRVFYPIGFDDNGLPTERYVEQAYGVRAVDMPRAEFTALCLAETQRVATVRGPVAAARPVGRLVAALLHHRHPVPADRPDQLRQAARGGLPAAGPGPDLWCPEDRTSLAQADVEDLERTSGCTRSGSAARGRDLLIATTRPELLPACVALYYHPGDARYAGLERAMVPLFGYDVPVLADESVDPEFGTGLMMVCTFGDGEDVLKWRRDGLPLRLVVSRRPPRRAGGPVRRAQLTQARSNIVGPGRGRAAGEQRAVRQVVGVHERCQTPVEFQIRPQWFIAVRENADRFRARAAEIEWIPPFMRRRLEDWIDGLKWDWNITRQRHYGVPFPVWFCAACAAPVLARLDDLPVDPLTDKPPVRCVPGLRVGGLARRPGRDGHLDDVLADPADQRRVGPAAHRSCAGADVHAGAGVRDHQDLAVLFGGAVGAAVRPGAVADRADLRLGAERAGQEDVQAGSRQITGADGFNRYVPDDVMAKYGADALRLWATKGSIGTDLRYNEKDIRTGRKFAVKLWNVGRFLSLNLGDLDVCQPAPHPGAERDIVDRWLLAHLASTVG